MSWIQPPEELTLGSKLSENCPMSRSNFAQYIWDIYIHYDNQVHLQVATPSGMRLL